MRKEVATVNAPEAIGPYAQANIVDNMVYLSGQLGIDPKTGMLKEGIDAQVQQALENLAAVLKEAGSDMNHVVKTTCFLQSMGDFPVVNDIYATHFTKPYPSRSAVEVGALPKGGLFEIEAIAYIK